MIKPTIGRVVLVYRAEYHVGSQWNTAQICAVNTDASINVAGFDRDGHSFIERNLTLRQDNIAESAVDLPTGLEDCPAFACWMPYQRQSAADSVAKVS